jgi:hypothetical protein
MFDSLYHTVALSDAQAAVSGALAWSSSSGQPTASTPDSEGNPIRPTAKYQLDRRVQESAGTKHRSQSVHCRICLYEDQGAGCAGVRSRR